MDRSALLKEFGFKEEYTEILERQYGFTGFPEPHKKFEMRWEVYDLSLEEPYFWVVDTLKMSFPYTDKLEDSFAAAENSAFFGTTQQKLGAQQDKVSQFLATVGKMIKELFQMVRELRIIDERMGYYGKVEEEINKDIGDREKGASITLKGFFVDLVQGGGKSAASVYGMARELEFTTLPDLFFDAPPFRTQTELENHVNNLAKDFNQNVLRVLIRHLTQYRQWRIRTAQEHRDRRRFMLQYLLQHYEIIRMYINWIKPYLRHVSKLTMKEKNQESVDIVTAFEGSMLDVEFIARKRIPVGDGSNGMNGCVLATFNYRTRPEMKVVQEGYQRGPVHIGKMIFQLRVYTWTDKELENYKKLKEKETFLLLGDVSTTVQKAMESLGIELERYLNEARGERDNKKVEEKKPKKKTVTEKLFGDFYHPKEKGEKGPKVSRKQMQAEVAELKKAAGELKGYTKYITWLTYKNFKKAHRMIQW